jgi:hypothetical protein
MSCAQQLLAMDNSKMINIECRKSLIALFTMVFVLTKINRWMSYRAVWINPDAAKDDREGKLHDITKTSRHDKHLHKKLTIMNAVRRTHQITLQRRREEEERREKRK